MFISFNLFKGDVARETERIFIIILSEFITTLPTENCPRKIREKAGNNVYQLDNLLHCKL